MQTFHIRYRNTQGTLMRILNAASRRALDLPVVQAEPAEHDHQVTLALEVNQKQVGQLVPRVVWDRGRHQGQLGHGARDRVDGAASSSRRADGRIARRGPGLGPGLE